MKKLEHGNLNMFSLSPEGARRDCLAPVSPSWAAELGQPPSDEPSQCTLEIVYTREGTFNFWALEVNDLIENLLYSRRIICAENESLQDYKAPVSISPVSPTTFPFISALNYSFKRPFQNK